MPRVYLVARNAAGDCISSSTYTVVKEGGGSAAIYSDENLSSAIADSDMKTGSKGEIEGYMAEGRYVFTVGGKSITYECIGARPMQLHLAPGGYLLTVETLRGVIFHVPSKHKIILNKITLADRNLADNPQLMPTYYDSFTCYLYDSAGVLKASDVTTPIPQTFVVDLDITNIGAEDIADGDILVFEGVDGISMPSNRALTCYAEAERAVA